MSRRLETRIGSIRLENPLIRGAGDVIGRAAGQLKSFAELPMRLGKDLHGVRVRLPGHAGPPCAVKYQTR